MAPSRRLAITAPRTPTKCRERSALIIGSKYTPVVKRLHPAELRRHVLRGAPSRRSLRCGLLDRGGRMYGQFPCIPCHTSFSSAIRQNWRQLWCLHPPTVGTEARIFRQTFGGSAQSRGLRQAHECVSFDTRQRHHAARTLQSCIPAYCPLDKSTAAPMSPCSQRTNAVVHPDPLPAMSVQVRLPLKSCIQHTKTPPFGGVLTCAGKGLTCWQPCHPCGRQGNLRAGRAGALRGQR